MHIGAVLMTLTRAFRLNSEVSGERLDKRKRRDSDKDTDEEDDQEDKRDKKDTSDQSGSEEEGEEGKKKDKEEKSEDGEKPLSNGKEEKPKIKAPERSKVSAALLHLG